MPDAARRRFRISDALILVAATAVGLATTRYAVGLDLFSINPGQTDPLKRFVHLYSASTTLAVPILTSLSLAALAISLRPPRAPLRRLAGEPGFAALAVAAATSAYHIVQFGLREVAKYGATRSFLDLPYPWMCANLAIEAGGNVAVAWLVLALQGRWKACPKRACGLGAVIGLIWVGLRAFHDFFLASHLLYVYFF